MIDHRSSIRSTNRNRFEMAQDRAGSSLKRSPSGFVEEQTTGKEKGEKGERRKGTSRISIFAGFSGDL